MIVNGDEVTREIEGRLLLVHFLRDHLGPDRHALGLRHEQLRRLRRLARRRAGEVVHGARRDGRRARGAHHRGARPLRRARHRPARLHGLPRAAVRVLHAGHADDRPGPARPQPEPVRARRSGRRSPGRSAAAPATPSIVRSIQWAAAEEPALRTSTRTIAGSSTTTSGRWVTAGCCARRTRGSCAGGAATSTTCSCPACCTWPSCARRSPTRGSCGSTSPPPRRTRR